MSDAVISLVILGVVIVLFVWNRLPVEIVAIGTGLALYATGLLTHEQVLSGFGDPVVIFIAALFVVSEGVSASGVTSWAGRQVVARAGAGPTRLLVISMLMCALLTALISLNGAVAALLPMVVALALKGGVATSRLLMPLAFAGSAGSMLALTGTPINVIVSDAAVGLGLGPFGFLEFGMVGVPLVVGTVLIAVVLGPRVLPERRPAIGQRDLGDYSQTMIDQYQLQSGMYRLRVREHSPLLGTLRGELAFERYPGLRLVAVRTADGRRVTGDEPIALDHVLFVRGDAATVSKLVVDRVLAVNVGVNRPSELAGVLVGDEHGVSEVVVPPRSHLVGETVHPGMVRGGDQVILAIQRLGKDLGPGETQLEVGDTMLILGSWEGLEQNVDNPALLVVDSPELVRKQTIPLGPKAMRAIAVLLGMVVLLIIGIVPAVIAALLAAGAMVLLRVVHLAQAYRAIPWTTIILVAGLIPLSTAIQDSGAADLLANALVSVVGGAGPYALMLALFLLIGALGQVVSNTATALIVLPIALTAAADLGVSARPVLMLVTVAAASSFLTPIATAANMMVMGPGHYEFGDYWKLGLPIMALFLVVAVFLVPVIWPF